MPNIPPLLKIFLLNFVAGIAIQIVIPISYILVFGFGGPVLTLSPAEEPPFRPETPPLPPIGTQAIGIFIVILYICLLIFGNRLLISDSPYKFEYRFVAMIGFAIGFLLFFGYVT